MYSIDIDIGGTFTDGFFSDGEQFRMCKVLTTPHDISECFMQCVRAGGEAFEVDLPDFLFRTEVARVSTTVGTNLLVQRAGPRVGLIVTEGAETSLYGNGEASILNRYVDQNMVVGVPEAVDADGKVVLELDQDKLLSAVRYLVQNGARMVVVSFRNAWRNPANEQRARAIVKERYPVHYLRSVPLQLGIDVAHVSDDHARTNSALLNAYVHTEMARRLYRAEDLLREAGFVRPLLVVHANGGNARVAKTVALNTLHSGPAAAVRGAVAMAKLLGLDKVVTADMGGTSLDVAVIRDGVIPMSEVSHVDGAAIAVPVIELDSVGAGGGSIASVSEGVVRVGPESAGSVPGPVCYGKGGTEPTVTDANVILGYIDPDYFLGGKMRLDGKAARRAVERRLARVLKMDVEDAGREIRAVVNRNIAEEMRQRLGAEPTHQYSLFAFGGCGPLHACSVAEDVGFRSIVAFPFASVFSAFGSSTTDIRHTYSRTLGVKADGVEEAASVLRTFRKQAVEDMIGEGFSADHVLMSPELRIVKSGQIRVVPLDVNGGEEEIRREVGSGLIDSVRLTAECPVPHWAPERRSDVAIGSPAPKGSRMVCWDSGARVESPIYDALAFRPGHRVDGPTVVEAPDTTIVVNAGWELTVDVYGNFIISR